MNNSSHFRAGKKNIFFAGENIVNKSSANTCCPRNIRDTRPMIPFTAEEIPRCGDDFFAACITNGFLTHACLHLCKHFASLRNYAKQPESSYTKAYHILIERSIYI